MADDEAALNDRFGTEDPDLVLPADAPAVHRQMAGRGSVRSFRDAPVPAGTLRRLCALALCAPTKSDLQQCDIVVVGDAGARREILSALAGGPLGQAWLERVPTLLVFCGNNRRQRRIHAMHGVDFANHHLDALFNVAVDAAMVLSAFVVAAEAEGLGVCPISAVRNQPDLVARVLKLGAHMVPVAGLAVGYPDAPPVRSLRLPLDVTVHGDAYGEAGLAEAVEAYDRRRALRQPYAAQRRVDAFGTSDRYGWSEDKVRQYSRPERDGFGAFVRRAGFSLD